jgi:endonuclease III
MTAHHFATREELHAFWKAGRGYLLNNYKNCLHRTDCETYSHNPPGMTYTRRGFDTEVDVLRRLGPEGKNWYSCPTCNSHIDINAASDSAVTTRVTQAPEAQSVVSVVQASQQTEGNSDQLIDVICKFGRTVPRFTTGLAAADDLVYSDGFAFLMACSLDRGTRSEVIWKIPYYLKDELGHLNPVRVVQMSIEEIRQTIQRLPVKPRYTNDAPYTILQLAQIITTEFGGRAELLWEGRSPQEIVATLRRIRGIDTIAHMTVNLLHRYLGVAFSVKELHDIDVKPDVHVERVFLRTGLMDRSGRSIQVARQLREAYPAELDLGSWEIGRRWCHASDPDHEQCVLSALCPHRHIS